MAQGNVSFKGKTVESLVVKFDQVKYEKFLFSGCKNPRVAQQYHRVSLEIRSQVSLETPPRMTCTNSVVSGRVTRVARFNVSYESHEANDVKGHLSMPLL